MSVVRVSGVRSLCLLSTIALASCKTFDEPGRPDLLLPDRFTTGSTSLSPAPSSAWWLQVRNNELSTLIERGLSNNLDIARAVERINVARQNVTIAAADAVPQIGIGTTTPSSGAISSSDIATISTPSAGLNVSWLLDVNGKIAKQKSASEAGLRAAGFDFSVVRLAFLADLITSYIDMNYFARTIAVTQESIKNATETLSLVRNMKELGTASDLDIVQAQVDLATLRASLPALERDRILAINHIATLIGATAGSLKLSGSSKQDPLSTTEITAGMPADLIRSRPDIRAREQLLYAAAERIGVARADLLPAVTLNGTINAAAVPTLYGMLGAATWTFGSAILAPVLDGGRRRATVRVAETEYQLRYLDWKQNVLAAVEEVENLLVSIQRGQRELASLRESVAANEKSLDLTRKAMTGGTGILLGVLDSQRSLNRSRLALAQSQRQLARYRLSLHIAIGAGADVAATPPMPAAIFPAAPAAGKVQHGPPPPPGSRPIVTKPVQPTA